MAFLTQGGSQITTDNIVDGTILNADINANAAIASSKLANPGYAVLAEATLGSAAASIDSGTFTAKRFIKILLITAGMAGNTQETFQFNGDTAANYTRTNSDDGAAVSTAAAQTALYAHIGAWSVTSMTVIEFMNVAARVKTITGHHAQEGHVSLIGGFWNNTTNQVTRVVALAGANFNAGATLVVLGHD